MEPPSTSGPSLVDRARTRRFRWGAVTVIALAVGLILWLIFRDTDGGGSSTPAGNVSAVTAGHIKSLAASVGHPIYWLGPKQGFTYELTKEPNGSVVIRYLPPTVKVGARTPYLSVATYPFPNALAGIRSVKGGNVVAFAIPQGGVAEYRKSYPVSVHLAYPDTNYQVEVYDPTPGNAKAIALAGQVTALGPQTPTRSSQTITRPTAASTAELKGVARSLGHPLYWTGPKQGFTYELTRTPTGTVYIRYLPPGVKVGTPDAYLSVATYPFPGAFDATRALGKQRNMETVAVPGGGIGVIGKAYPNSIHVAFPGSDYQVELFDPSAAEARRIVSSGQVSTIG